MNNTEELVAIIGKKCTARNHTLTVAESITAGGIAQALTTVSGASEWFGFGFITYSKVAKAQMLGIGRILQIYDVVSSEVAIAMAQGALTKSGADIAISVTGIAGPTGGTSFIPVGTVFCGLANKQKTKSHHWQFTGTREEIRAQTISQALLSLAEFLA